MSNNLRAFRTRTARRSAASLALTQLEDRSTPAALPLAPQFTVAGVTGSEAGPPVVAVVNPAGDFVAAWESLETDGSGVGVYTQAFLADGTPVGTPSLANQTTAGNQSRPTIATDGSGHVVLAWQSESAGGGAYDVYYRTAALDTGGATPVFTLSSTELPANLTTAGSQTNPAAAMDANGVMSLVWQTDQNLATTGLDIYGRYGTYAAGLLGTVDSEISIATGDQRNPTSAMAATGVPAAGDGRAVVAWTGPGPISSEGEATNVVVGTVFAYNAALTLVGPTDAAHTEYQLTAAAQHDQVNAAVAMTPDGRFVLVWQAEGQQGSGSDVFSRRFDANGDGLDATNVLVNTVTSQPQRGPAVGIDAGGNYFVTWQSQGADSKSWGIVGRAFLADGTELRADFIVNVNEQGPQTSPAVAVGPNGNAVAVWAGPFVPSHGGTEGEEGVEGEGGHQPSLFARRFGATGSTDVAPGIGAVNVNGLEFQLAVVGAGEDVPAAAAILSDGTYVVVWQAFEEADDASGFGVYGQRVAADGTLIGAKFLVNTTTLGYQSHPAVAALPGNGFVVVWQTETRTANGYDVVGRVFTQDGAGALVPGAEFVVNEATLTGHQTAPAVASDAAGNFVVVWQSDAQDATEDLTEIYGRRFATSGTTATPLAAEFRVNTETATTQYSPQVAMNAAGQFAVAWVSDHNVVNDPTDTEKSVFVRWYGADGVAPNPEFLANVYTKDAQEHPAIGIDAAGDLVVAWQSINQATGTGVSWDVFARQFRPDGTSPQAQEFQVNETVAAPQRFPAVGVDGAGRFAIAWQTINQDGSSWAVFQRQYRADGTPETGEQVVNTVTSGPQIEPVYARGVLGNYDLFWSGTMAEHVDGIGGRAFGINAVPTAPNMTGPGGPVDGNERAPLVLPVTIAAADLDVFETLSVVITGVPDYATLSAGVKQPDGSWVLAPGDLAGLTVQFSHEGTATLTITGVATEDKTGREATTVLTVPMTAANVDSFAVDAGSVAGIERKLLPLPIGIVESTPGIYEVLSVVVAGLPADATLSGGIRRTDGSWELTAAQLPGLTVRAAREGAATLGITITARDRDSDRLEIRTRLVTFTAANVDVYAVGGGGSGLVRQYGLDGALIREIDAFPGFTGGVHVATGDLTGDGVPDLIVGAGPGGGPHVKAYDGATGAQVRSFFAYDPTFRGGVIVAAGDLDGDGVAEIVTSPTEGGGPHIRAFDGVTGAEVRSFFAYDSSLRNGASVAVGDVTGDGKADIITAPLAGGGPHVKVFDGITQAVVQSFQAFEESFRGGVYLAVGNVVGDGRMDIIAGPGDGGGSRARVFDGHDLSSVTDVFAFGDASRAGVRVGAIDRDGDGRSELLLGAGPGDGPVVKILEPISLDVLDTFLAFDPADRSGVWVG
ncbi:VCBS repeat-containing protein [Urbifossiella limnaea]|uniref:FG-GAP repeat protein n=1 Tax=Urbifossiella limnaea TaxID=2528023 RepID=A0A517Y245_9BACT|nr:VCBS repeat-containing protein [Urbifossiella limnaea]QDU23846.1 FG-GAP repeat protein [Urbifossiella limnaea]